MSLGWKNLRALGLLFLFIYFLLDIKADIRNYNKYIQCVRLASLLLFSSAFKALGRLIRQEKEVKDLALN